MFGEFQCIADQVDEDLADPGRVAAQLVRNVGSDPGAQGQALVARLIAEHAHDAIDQRLQREVAIVDFEVAGFQAGKIENVVDQFEQVLRGIPGQAQQFLLVRVEAANLEHVQRADHAVQRGPDFVADGGCEIGLEPGEAQGAVARRT